MRAQAHLGAPATRAYRCWSAGKAHASGSDAGMSKNARVGKKAGLARAPRIEFLFSFREKS